MSYHKQSIGLAEASMYIDLVTTKPIGDMDKLGKYVF